MVTVQRPPRSVDPDGQPIIGRCRPRPDSEAKVRGLLRYGADGPIPRMLHARPVLSPYAHAHIRSVDKKPALAVPGVVAVLTAEDLAIAASEDRRLFEPLARHEVMFAGQPVALLLAETYEAGAEAVQEVLVEYEPLPAVVDPMAAMRLDSPSVRNDPIGRAEVGSGDESDGGAGAHAAVGGAADSRTEDEALSANVNNRYRFHEGDVAAALGEAAVVVQGRFPTSWMYQAYLEPQTATAWIDPDGTLVLEASTQGTFFARADVAKALGLPLARIRVAGTPLGGAFGGKLSVIEPLVAAAAIAVGRPVRLVFDRREDFLAANPAPGTILDVRLGATADGSFVGLEARLVLDAGAYPDSWLEEIAPVLLAGPYRWPAFDVTAVGVRTNRVGAGPYRGPGGPQTAFALETLVDELAGRLDIDPLEIRLRNVADEGSPMIDGEPWPAIGLRECLAQVALDPLWLNRRALPPGDGVGLAAGVWPGSKDAAAAMCRVEPDGTVTVVTGMVDMTGTAGAFEAIAAEAMGLSLEAVRVVAADTAAAPLSPVSGGSTVTYSVGRAVRLAALDARDRLLRAAARDLEISLDDLEIVEGTIRPRGAPQLGMTVAEVARRTDGSRREPLEGHATSEHQSTAPSAVAHVAHVRVDLETGVVRPLGHHVVQDVGRAINPALVEGQMQGAAGQAIGWALHEALVYDEGGQLVSGSFLDYSVPGAEDVPPLGVTIVQVPAPEGPFGAKGIGEAGVVPGAAAVANAVAAAAGVRLRELPMTPNRVWRALQDG